VFSLLVAFIYVLKATPIYNSESRLYVEQTGPRIINDYEGVMTQSKNYLYTQEQLLKSTPIVGVVADDTKIRRLRTFADIDNHLSYIKKSLRVEIGSQDDIITVSLDSPYPVEAAEIVNAVVKSYVDYHNKRQRSTVSEVLGILQKEKTKRDKELSGKFAEVLKFTEDNGIVSLDAQGHHVVFDRLSKLSNALTEAQLNAVNRKADYEATKGMSGEPEKVKQFAAASPTSGIRVFVDDIETQLQSELRAAETELREALYHCTEDHPSVQAINAKISQINQELDEEAKDSLNLILR